MARRRSRSAHPVHVVYESRKDYERRRFWNMLIPAVAVGVGIVVLLIATSH